MSDIPAEELKRRIRDAMAARDADRGAMDFSPEESAAAFEAMPWRERSFQDGPPPGESGHEVFGDQPSQIDPYMMGYDQAARTTGLEHRGPSRQEVEAALAAREDDDR